MKENKDISIYLASLLLIVVVGVFGFVMNRDVILASFDRIIPIVNDNKEFLGAIIGSFALNLFFVSALFERIFGFRKQGSRLRSIKGESLNIVIMQVIGLAVVIYLPFYYFFLGGFIENGINATVSGFNVDFMPIANKLINGTFFVSILFLSSYTLSIFKIIKRVVGKIKILPLYPKNDNEIVLGTVGEEESFDNEIRPRWMKLSQKALNGNILVTGSIGSGKTQGTVLSYIEQILNNFKPRPSMLILDPKRTLIPEVLEMAETFGLKEYKL